MRKQERVIIWPAYFDSTKSADEGRRVPKSLAVAVPRISEMKDAAETLGLGHQLVVDASYPKMPWLKTGMLLVDKKGSKTRTVLMVAGQLQKTRAATQPKQKD